MQQEDGTRPFDFPYAVTDQITDKNTDKMAGKTGELVLADFDVIGCQGPRLRRLVKLSKDCPFTLKTHEHWVPASCKDEYLQAVQAFLRSFPMVSVIAHEAHYEDEFVVRLLADFPQTMKLVGDYSERLLADYFSDFQKAHWLLEDHLNWWPLYLKEKYKKPEIFECANYEWSLAKLDFIDLPIYRRADPGQLYANPTIQLSKIEHIAKTLGKEPGVYIVYRSSDESQVLEMKLNTQVAQVLDVMSEERKFSMGQLTDWLQQESEFRAAKPSEILHLVQRLIRDSVLIQKRDAF